MADVIDEAADVDPQVYELGIMWPGPPLTPEQIEAHPLVRKAQLRDELEARVSGVSSLCRGVQPGEIVAAAAPTDLMRSDEIRQVLDHAHPTLKPPPPRAA